MQKPRVAHHITKNATTVSECLKQHFRMGERQIQDMLALGAIYSNKKRILEDRALSPGTYLRLHLDPKRYEVAHIDWRSRIVHEAKDFLVVNKPPGIPVHASLDNNQENVLFQLRRVLGVPLFVTQRLDIPVAGVFVLAKSPEFQRTFNRWLAEQKIHKRYWALTDKPLPLGLHTHFMENSERAPKNLNAEAKPGWLRCELTVEKCDPVDGGFRSLIRLHTGRTHQIRAQLQALGAPIRGDRLYGSTQGFRPHQIGLVSGSVELPPSVGPVNKFELAGLPF